jgi:hypothetical protein
MSIPASDLNRPADVLIVGGGSAGATLAAHHHGCRAHPPPGLRAMTTVPPQVGVGNENPHERNDTSPSPIEVVGQWLENLLDPEVVNRVVAPAAIYVSLNTDNPELHKIMPWAGTSRGPSSTSPSISPTQNIPSPPQTGVFTPPPGVPPPPFTTHRNRDYPY